MNIANLLRARNDITRGQWIGETLAGCWAVAIVGMAAVIVTGSSAAPLVTGLLLLSPL